MGEVDWKFNPDFPQHWNKNLFEWGEIQQHGTVKIRGLPDFKPEEAIPE